MWFWFFAILVVSANLKLAESSSNGTGSELKSKQTEVSPEVGGEETEIESGRSLVGEAEPKSDDSFYGDYDESDDADEASGQHQRAAKEKPTSEASARGDAAPEGVPTEVFLAMRNLTEEGDASRTFEKRIDAADSRANGTAEEALGWNSRSYRDAGYPPEVAALPQPHSPFQHAKIDTGDLSDCALQGEWKPIGDIQIDASQDDLQREHDYLIPAGTHEALRGGSFGHGVATGDHDSYSSFQNYFVRAPAHGSFAEFQKLTADAASALSGGGGGFDLNQHLQKYVLGGLPAHRGADSNGIGLSHGPDGGIGFNDLYKHTAGNVLSYNHRPADSGSFPSSHAAHGLGIPGDLGGLGGAAAVSASGGTKFYHGQGSFNYVGSSGSGAAGYNGYHKGKGSHVSFGPSSSHSSGAFASISSGGHARPRPSGISAGGHHVRYPPGGHQFHRKPGQGIPNGDHLKPKDPFLSISSKPLFYKPLFGKKPGGSWKSHKTKTRESARRPPTSLASGDALAAFQAAGSVSASFGGHHGGFGHGSGEGIAGLVSDAHLSAEGGQAESIALASTAGSGFAADHGYEGQGIGHITHEAILQDASQLTSFTCGKNHDRGTNYHTASFQVSDDDHGSQDLLQYQDGAHVIIHSSNAGFDDVLHAERKLLEDADAAAAGTDGREPASGSETVAGGAAGLGNHRAEEKGSSADLTEESTSQASYFRQAAQGGKFAAADAGPVQFGYGRDDSEPEKPKIVRELEDLSSRFRLETSEGGLDSSPQKVVSYEGLFEGEEPLGSDASRAPVFRGGYGLVDARDPRAGHEDRSRGEDEAFGEFPRYAHGIGQEREPSRGEIPGRFRALPVVISEHHPAKEEKPRTHLPPKRKNPGKQYEVHETGGEKQKPATEIFPPQKFPRQFHNRTPNFAIGKPPGKFQRVAFDGLPPYGAIPIRSQGQPKAVKKYRPIPGKVKFPGPPGLRRPTTDAVRITAAPLLRVSVSS